MANNGFDAYKKTDVNTASQGKLVVMLYDGAIKFLEDAIKAFDKDHATEEVHTNLVKGQDIIAELLASINYDAGDIANKLASIYSYINKRLLEANVKKEKEPVIECVKYLKEIKSAWDQIVDQNPSYAQSASTQKPNTQTKTQKPSSGKINIAG